MTLCGNVCDSFTWRGKHVCAHTLQVPPLRVRPTDIAAMQAYFLRERERRIGSGSARGGPRLALTPAALRHIESCAEPPAWV